MQNDNTKLKVFLGADHRGFQLKEKIKQWLAEFGYELEDCGALEYDEADDYPDFAKKVTEKIVSDPNSRGVLICGSGIGVCVAANKIKNVRAGTAASPEQIKAAVNDEDLNILCLAADYPLNADIAQQIVKTFLETRFSGEKRHVRRVNKIKEMETAS